MASTSSSSTAVPKQPEPDKPDPNGAGPKGPGRISFLKSSLSKAGEASLTRWETYLGRRIDRIAEANGFLQIEMGIDLRGLLRIMPDSCFIFCPASTSPSGVDNGYLLQFKIVDGSQVRGDRAMWGTIATAKTGDAYQIGGDHLQIEQICDVDIPALKFELGPVQTNWKNLTRNLYKVDFGKFLSQPVSETTTDPMRPGKELVHTRWWVCTGVLKLLCLNNGVDAESFDIFQQNRPISWVLLFSGEDNKDDNDKSASESAALADKSAASNNSKSSNNNKSAKAKQAKQQKQAKGPSPQQLREEHLRERLSVFVKEGDGLRTPFPGDMPMQETEIEVCVTDKRPTEAPGTTRELFHDLLVKLQTSTPTRSVMLGVRGRHGTVDPRKLCLKVKENASKIGAKPVVGKKGKPFRPLVKTWVTVGHPDTLLIRSTGVLQFTLSQDRAPTAPGPGSGLGVSPRAFWVAFPTPDPKKDHLTLLHLSIVRHGDIPELNGIGEGPYCESVEFELMSFEDQPIVPEETTLRFSTGPIRLNPVTRERESMRLNLDSHIRWARKDYVQNSPDSANGAVARLRWWIPIETFKLVCRANDVDAGVLEGGTSKLEWVACLAEERTLPSINSPSQPGAPPTQGGFSEEAPAGPSKGKAGVTTVSTTPPPSTANLAPASAPPSKSAKKRQKQKSKTTEAQPSNQPPVMEERLIDETNHTSGEAADKLLRSFYPSYQHWKAVLGEQVKDVCEVASSIYLKLGRNNPTSSLVSFPDRYLIFFQESQDEDTPTNTPTGLLRITVVPPRMVPDAYREINFDLAQSDRETDFLQFEFLVKKCHLDRIDSLRISFGPVRTNPATGKQESMRVDMGQCLRRLYCDTLLSVTGDDPHIRSRWWVSLAVLRCICTSNNLDDQVLDGIGPPIDWVLCMRDARLADRPTTREEASEAGSVELPSLPHKDPATLAAPSVALRAAVQPPQDAEAVNLATQAVELLLQAAEVATNEQNASLALQAASIARQILPEASQPVDDD